MALQSSGEISFVDLQGEWGGINPIRLSNYYLGSLPTGRTNYGSIPSSGQISLSDFYGTDAALSDWTSTMTVSSYTIFKTAYWGYNSASAGSLSDTTIDTFNNYEIIVFSWNSANTVGLALNTENIPNSGWTSIKVNSTTFTRASATYFSNAGSGQSNWQWTGVTTNPFGTTGGATRTITFII